MTVLQGLGGDFTGTSAGQRERMMGATQVMEKTNERLAYAKQQLGQTEVSRGLGAAGHNAGV